MMSKVFKERNREIRKARPLISTEDACEIYETDSVLEISLSRGRCANDANGACIMCNYGEVSKNKSIASYLQAMEHALDSCGNNVTCLMLCTNGSIFDERQIEEELLEKVIEIAARCQIPHIEFETHYNDITEEKLRLLQGRIRNKEIIIAIGLETINQTYQDYIIGKRIELSKFEEKISLVKQFGFQLEVNIMLGLPFLTTREQFEDTCNTVKWAFAHQCRPVLFPINIKPYSLLKEMYDAGYYSPISHWLLLLVLDTLSEQELEQVILVWYGNRIEDYGDESKKQIFPACCDKCQTLLDRFYVDFITSTSGKARRQILNIALNISSCDCLKNVQDELKHVSSINFLSRYKAFEKYLEEQKRRNAL